MRSRRLRLPSVVTSATFVAGEGGQLGLLLDELEPVHDGHVDVEQDHVGGFLLRAASSASLPFWASRTFSVQLRPAAPRGARWRAATASRRRSGCGSSWFDCSRHGCNLHARRPQHAVLVARADANLALGEVERHGASDASRRCPRRPARLRPSRAPCAGSCDCACRSPCRAAPSRISAPPAAQTTSRDSARPPLRAACASSSGMPVDAYMNGFSAFGSACSAGCGSM
jgi:hypothetical protein